MLGVAVLLCSMQRQNQARRRPPAMWNDGAAGKSSGEVGDGWIRPWGIGSDDEDGQGDERRRWRTPVKVNEARASGTSSVMAPCAGERET